ncbi:hypothetical protein B0H34DRAFT_107949 [Crassisporium funariophilum]|nr:hypothetical protein B0H34DRAFT_107949 [Crassisporium funariophilum]
MDTVPFKFLLSFSLLYMARGRRISFREPLLAFGIDKGSIMHLFLSLNMARDNITSSGNRCRTRVRIGSTQCPRGFKPPLDNCTWLETTHRRPAIAVTTRRRSCSLRYNFTFCTTFYVVLMV